jgi:hypothetical protein
MTSAQMADPSEIGYFTGFPEWLLCTVTLLALLWLPVELGW